MFVIGFDPGLSRCGYCVLAPRARRAGAGAVAVAAAIGVIRTPPDMPTPQRLAMLQRDVRDLFDEFPPVAVAIERVLFQNNVSTAIPVGQASGIIMADAANRGCDVVEYSPNQVKEAVAGYGSAGKEQVQEMVRRLLGHDKVLRPADAADAAAVALCHVAYNPDPARPNLAREAIR